MKIKAVIFDIDGTLVDTGNAHVKTWQQAFTAEGYDISADKIKNEIGKGGDNLVPSLLGEEKEQEEGNALRKVKEQAFTKLTKEEQFNLFPGVENLLAAVKEKGLKIAIATSAKMEEFEAIVKNIGFDLKDKADTVTTSADADSSKPDPDIVLAAVTKLGLSPDECVMIGDTSYDVDSARKAGVSCIGVTTGFHTAENLEKAGAAAVYKDTVELLLNLDEALQKASGN